MDPKGYGGPSNSGGDMVAKPKGQQESGAHWNSNSGNYINVVPMAVGVQYHRRKYSPQIPPDYQ